MNTDQIEHKMALEAIGFAAQVLASHKERYELLIESERNMHSIGHILDPTLYRDMIHSKNFEWQMRLVRAALAFLREFEAVRELAPRPADPHRSHVEQERREEIIATVIKP